MYVVLLCYISEECDNFDRDVRCIIDVVEPLDIRLLGLLGQYQQYTVFCTSIIIKVMHCCISTKPMVTQVHHNVTSTQLTQSNKINKVTPKIPFTKSTPPPKKSSYFPLTTIVNRSYATKMYCYVQYKQELTLHILQHNDILSLHVARWNQMTSDINKTGNGL